MQIFQFFSNKSVAALVECCRNHLMKGIKKGPKSQICTQSPSLRGTEFQLKADYNGPPSFGGAVFPPVTQNFNVPITSESSKNIPNTTEGRLSVAQRVRARAHTHTLCRADLFICAWYSMVLHLTLRFHEFRGICYFNPHQHYQVSLTP